MLQHACPNPEDLEGRTLQTIIFHSAAICGRLAEYIIAVHEAIQTESGQTFTTPSYTWFLKHMDRVSNPYPFPRSVSEEAHRHPDNVLHPYWIQDAWEKGMTAAPINGPEKRVGQPSFFDDMLLLRSGQLPGRLLVMESNE